MCEIYKVFAHEWEHVCTFSDAAALELYNYESYGQPMSNGRPYNGFAVGKHWLNVTVAGWREDIRTGYLFRSELYDDGKYPHWWLDSVLKGCEDNFHVWKKIRDNHGKPNS